MHFTERLNKLIEDLGADTKTIDGKEETKSDLHL